MEDNRMFEDISIEEFEEAMEGFEQWRREVAEEDGEPFDELLRENSGLLSRMKERDGNEKLNQICEESFKKVLDK